MRIWEVLSLCLGLDPSLRFAWSLAADLSPSPRKTAPALSIAASPCRVCRASVNQIFECMNIAALWDLPIIYVFENNHYGMGTAEWRAAKSHKYFTRGDYIPGLKVDGMDVLAVKQAFTFAREHALSKGPIVLELDTYRYHGHSMSDPGSTYRTRDEVAGIRQERDPVERVRKLLLATNLATDAELKVIEKAARARVDAAIEFAKASPEPGAELMYQNIYVEQKGFEMRGVDSGATVVLK